MTRLDDMEARVKADPGDTVLADLVKFARDVEAITDRARGVEPVLNTRRDLRAALDRLNGGTHG